MRSQREDFSDMVAEVCYTYMLANFMILACNPPIIPDCSKYISVIAAKIMQFLRSTDIEAGH